MSLTVAIIGLVMVLVFVLPVVLINRQSNKRNTK
jgi:hypothetical protein